MADQGTEGLLSPYLRRKRFEAAKPFLKGTVLDFGCGSGALAAIVPIKLYLGLEIDKISLRRAQSQFPQHRFVSALPDTVEKFDSVVSLAVIEHVDDSVAFLSTLTSYLNDTPEARVIVTTPHPSIDWVHDIGAEFGLFSKHASQEHEELLDRSKLEAAGMHAGLNLLLYKRFLFGANQIAVFERIS